MSFLPPSPAHAVTRAYHQVLLDVVIFAEQAGGLRLRQYQQQVARAIVTSVLQEQGLTFAVIFPRQSGKNELQAHIEAYLLTLFSETGADMVKVSPTWKPQSLNAMRRLERVLSTNEILKGRWRKESGYIYRVGQATLSFLSASPTTNIVGATASLLLECDETQDVLISKWDKEIGPMAASTNATRVFWGTAWTSQTLLAREMRRAAELQAADGRPRLFLRTAKEVSAEVPAYGSFVEGEIARLGSRHPVVRTQYFCEEIDAESGMFPLARQALLHGRHPRRQAPEPGKIYAFLLDVAGEDENALPSGALSVQALANPARDATALTVVEVDLESLSDELIQAPTYKVVDRRLWVGVKHTALYARLKALVQLWEPRCLVIDATGVGAGLASFLDKAFPGRVLPFIFTTASKSKLGWDFLSLVETRRFQDWQIPPSPHKVVHPMSQPGTFSALLDEQALFYQQLSFCQMEIIPGPAHRMQWGVPDGTRDPSTGELVHDDLLISAALCAVLDGQPWGLAESGIIAADDPLRGLREAY